MRELKQEYFASIEQARAKSKEDSRDEYETAISAQSRLSDADFARRVAKREQNTPAAIPTISLSKDALKDTWKVEKLDDKFIVTGEKIEKFARRTDLNNYASVNRLRDIMKKLGIRAELTTQGAKPDSIISIAGKEFTLVEDW